jgi:hypothetical protein
MSAAGGVPAGVPASEATSSTAVSAAASSASASASVPASASASATPSSTTDKTAKLKEDNKKLKNLIKLARGRIEEQEVEINKLSLANKQQDDHITKQSKESIGLDPFLHQHVQRCLTKVRVRKMDSASAAINLLYGDNGGTAYSIASNSIASNTTTTTTSSSTDDDDSLEVHALFQTVPMPVDDDPPHVVTQRHWRAFDSDHSLQQFVNKHQGHGEPVVIPAEVMGENEAADLQEECEARIREMTEEFRKFRVKASVTQKEMEGRIRRGERKEVEKLADSSENGGNNNISNGSRPAQASSREEAKAQLDALRREKEESESQWREAYDALLRENDQLKSKGGEAAIASQWRLRYETSVREREDVESKLTMVEARLAAALSGSGGSNGGSSRPGSRNGDENMAEKYQKLRDEYSLYRKEAKKILEGYRNGAGGAGGSGGGGVGQSNGGQNNVYLKNTLIQYLSVSDGATRERMEPGILMALNLSPAEMKQIEAKKKASSSSEAGWFG